MIIRAIKVISISIGCCWAALATFQLLIAKSESLPNTSISPVDYISLISKKNQSKLALKYTFNSKVRNPVSIFEFDAKEVILIYKINLDFDGELSNLVEEHKGGSNRSSFYAYSEIGKKLYSIYFKQGPVNSIEKIYLTYDCDSLKIIQRNDSIASYYLATNSFSLRFEKNASKNIVFESQKNFFMRRFFAKPIPVCLSLIKKNKAVYFLIMTNDSENELKSNMLDDIIYGHENFNK